MYPFNFINWNLNKYGIKFYAFKCFYSFTFSCNCINAFDCISSATGISIDYILYGKGENNKLKMKETLYNMIDKGDKEELQVYYKCINTIKSYVIKKEKIKDSILKIAIFYVIV